MKKLLLNPFISLLICISFVIVCFGQTDAFAAETTKGNTRLEKPRITVSNQASTGKPFIKWESISSAKNYKIYRATSLNGTYKVIKETKENSYIDKDTTVGKKFYYRVKALSGKDSIKDSLSSDKSSTTCALPRPIVETSSRFKDAKPILSWNSVNGASEYEIYRSESKSGNYKKIFTTSKCSFVNTGAKETKTYYYKVKTISKKTSAANSAFSKIVSRRCGSAYIVSVTDTKYTYKDFKSDMDQMLEKYPKYLTKRSYGKTVDDRGLYALVLGNPDAKKQIFVTAGFHAREYINCQVVMRQLEYYCRNYNSSSYKEVKYSKLFDKVSICIMPMVNPDGIEISAYGADGINDSSLRNRVKNLGRNGSYSNWKANARGVDLNRNYTLYNGYPNVSYYYSEDYPGPSRFSEKETKAVLSAMDDCRNIKAVINYHSMGRIIYWGYHSQKYKQKCYAFAKLFRDITGYGLVNESYDATYGDFEHYVMHEHKIPYVCIENGKGKVPVPNSELKGIYDKNRLGFAKAAYHFY